jgi:hypothetical protein
LNSFDVGGKSSLYRNKQFRLSADIILFSGKVEGGEHKQKEETIVYCGNLRQAKSGVVSQ